MDTINERKVISSGRFVSSGSSLKPVAFELTKKEKIKESISWAVCFGLIAGLTGLMKFMKVGITMDTVTSSLFYMSLASLGFFIFRVVKVSKSPSADTENRIHDLN